MIAILILLLAAFEASLIDYLFVNPTYYQLDAYTWEQEEFRAMNLGSAVASRQDLDLDWLTTQMIENQYDLTGKSPGGQYDSRPILDQKPAEYQKLLNAYQVLLTDLKYFPVPRSLDPQVPWVEYEDGWGRERSYGGERRHEGCDLMGDKMERGYYPVISMSDGVVEKVGWLEKGGYRLGIRSPGGLYLYYAHLYGYSREWKEGDAIRAGQLIGYMGDTGYSKVEGTTGNFQVHLHVGIYMRTDHYEEMSVNPYWLLRRLEGRAQLYDY